ncbi:hypothetical protein PISMIDRAFT_17880 [Pisolithus microcarpus 441]|uniref:Uncharacterized protein n=1 Tax=Pisolithus microcarpus 441 TaxID=765257 RepID=A0A0C9XMJ2_9AGAM|nr:hypothetical protein PISMIDRAFT_17880 [Pisolithus microcarpus 441]
MPKMLESRRDSVYWKYLQKDRLLVQGRRQACLVYPRAAKRWARGISKLIDPPAARPIEQPGFLAMRRVLGSAYQSKVLRAPPRIGTVDPDYGPTGKRDPIQHPPDPTKGNIHVANPSSGTY